jgi:hypothetical protein
MHDPANRLDQLARSAAFEVTARAVNVVGVPAMLGLLFWLFATVSALEKDVARLPVLLQSLKGQLEAAERRIQRLEDPFFRGRN